MKKWVLFIAAFMTVGLLSGVASGIASAADGTVTYNVKDFGAVSSDKKDSSKVNAEAFNQALGQAKNSDVPIKVTIPKGTYHIDSPLRIYSNTALVAEEGVEIVADFYDDSSTMLSGFHLPDSGSGNCSGSSCTHKKYSQLNHITIEGGTWSRTTDIPSGKAGSMSIFRLRHGQNITIRNLVCKNATTHFFNLSSTKDVLVENVTFQNSREVTDNTSRFWGEEKDTDNDKHGNKEKYNGMEAIHLDICDGSGESGEPAMPFDNTPCNNITVQNCTFTNVWSGVGNHHSAKTNRTSKVKVLNNTFTNMRWYCVYAIDFDDLTIQGNTAANTEGIANLRGIDQAVVSKNGYTVTTAPGGKFDSSLVNPVLKIVDASGTGTTIVQNNTITNNLIAVNKKSVAVTDADAIVVKGCNNTTISKNKVSMSKGRGISVQTSTGVTVSGNTVAKTAGDAMYILGEKGTKCTATIKDNTLSSATTLRKDGNKGYDLKLSNYAVKCKLSGNTLKNYAFYVHPSTASYMGSIDLPVLKKVKLSKSSFVYSGKAQTPSVTVIDSKGRTLTEGVHYRLFYGQNIKVGTAYVSVKGIETFLGQKKQVKFKITL